MGQAKVKCGVPRFRDNDAAFSRVELLAVLSVVALLVAIQFPAFGHNQGNSHRAVCADNLRRLAAAWQMYVDDNRGRLVPNRSDGTTNNWVAAPFDAPGSGLNDPRTITLAKLYRYAKTIEIYRCPDDLSARYTPQFGYLMAARSYSMSGWIGEGTSDWWASGFQLMTSRSQIKQPDQTFVFIEEHPDSINDGVFVVDMSASGYLVDFPASYHYSGANLGFADGSVRYHQWSNVPAIITPSFPRISGSDLGWLQSVSTYRK